MIPEEIRKFAIEAVLAGRCVDGTEDAAAVVEAAALVERYLTRGCLSQTSEPIPAAGLFRVEASAPQRIADLILNLVDGLLSLALAEPFTKLTESADKTVSGAEELVFRLEFDAGMFNEKVRSALRAGGLELPEGRHGHSESPVGGVATPSMEDAGRVGNDPAGASPAGAA